MSIKVGPIEFVRQADWLADTSYLEQEDFADRLAAYERGDFGFIGIYATCELLVEGVRQSVRSSGLWGIESDSGDDYFYDVEQEELNELRGILAALGIDAPAEVVSAAA